MSLECLVVKERDVMAHGTGEGLRGTTDKRCAAKHFPLVYLAFPKASCFSQKVSKVLSDD